MTRTALLAIAKKEALEHTRRGGVLILAGLFFVVTLGAGYAYAALAGGGSLSNVLSFMETSVGFLIPLIGMVVAHGTIAGEAETGSLALLLAQPVSRAEVAIGKFLGLFAVVAGAEVVGFGLAGLFIASRISNFDWATFGIFIFATILFAGAYLGLFIVFSTFAKRRATALVYSMSAWILFGAIWSPLLIYFASGGNVQGIEMSGFPPWFQWGMLLSPPDVFTWYLLAATGIPTTIVTEVYSTAVHNGVTIEGLELLPNPYFTGAALIAWIGATGAAAWLILSKRDL
ncbi:MAG: ABC transporter permease [Thermoplasmatota archaeon]